MGPPLRQTQPATTANTIQHTSNTLLSPESLPGLSSSSGTPSPQPSGLGMTPASRYDNNLRVMRKRDASISSIIDQFSHVCVYHHNGQNWDKHGFEGSMFLFERDSYPPYGLYVMNRQGKDDYVQRLYPEDDIVPSDKFLIIKSYPKYSEAKLKNLASLHPGQGLDRFSEVYAFSNVDETSRGRPTIKGLWMFQDNSRDSLTEVMQRLHAYIRKNKVYPEEFRYGPGRPPPPNRLRAIPKRTAGSTSDSQAQRIHSDSENERSYYSDAPNLINRGLSDIDKLFLKLGSHVVPSSKGGNTIPQSDPSNPASSGISLTQGPALLQQIFASASSPISAPADTTMATSSNSRQNATVFSPQPSVGTLGPQILNSQVLTSILTGSAPSRASSVVSHPSSREGDNEGGSDSPSTVLDEDSDYLDHRSIHRRAPRVSANGSAARPGPKVNGDVTPRLQLNGLQRMSSVTETSSVSTTRPTSNANPPPPFSVQDASYLPVKRELTPFESDSDLWPSSQYSTTNTDDDGSDIVELNFEDTSLLSNPEFTKVVKQRKSAVMLRQADAASGAVRPVNGSGYPSVASEKIKGKNRRKRKEKEDVEKYRDLSTVPPAATRGRVSEKIFENGNPSTSRSLSSVPVHQKPVPVAGVEKTPTMSGTMVLPRNGPSSTSSKSKGKMVNGHTEASNGIGVGTMVNPEAVRLTMAPLLHGQHPISSVGKTEFVQQVLQLLQTDERFSEKLYMDYIARA